MQFQPKSLKEIEDSKLLKAGVYSFEILDAWEKTSAAGNDMIELQVQVSSPREGGGNGTSKIIGDYLLPKRAEKLLHCCIACGCRDAYERGELSPEDFRHKTGRLKLAIEKGRKSENGKFPDRNVIEAYIPG